MAKRLVVLSSSELTICFLIQGDTPYKISVEKREGIRLVDSIFKGKVKRLAKGMEGVFVDVGIGKDAFLPLKGESYRVGESLIVQMVREPEQEKGAKLTTNIKLIGKYVIYLPKGKELKCSSKLKAGEREELCRLLENELKEEGVILRSSSAKAEPEKIKEELHKLRELWQWVQKKEKSLKKPQVILEEYPAYIRFIRDHWQELEEVVSDDPLIWNHIASFLDEFEPEMLRKNLYVKDPTSYVYKYELHETLRSVLSKVVWLKSGGYIVIEETEAFTIIDVNSGDPTGSSHEENALKTNLEAVGEIARQIILRDIGGIILVDFIDMKKQESKNLMLTSIQSAFGEESCSITLCGFTKLGILEMVRKKTGRSISKMLTEECPTCSGSGYIKSSSLFLLELEKELMNYPQKSVEVQVHPLRYDKVRSVLNASGYSQLKITENQELSINQYQINHA